MNKLSTHYLAIFGPLMLLVVLSCFDRINSFEFTIGILSYGLLYHPIISFFRMKKIRPDIDNKIYEYILNPMLYFKYFKYLYMKNEV